MPKRIKTCTHGLQTKYEKVPVNPGVFSAVAALTGYDPDLLVSITVTAESIEATYGIEDTDPSTLPARTETPQPERTRK